MVVKRQLIGTGALLAAVLMLLTDATRAEGWFSRLITGATSSETVSASGDYAAACGSCHIAYRPHLLPAVSWELRRSTEAMLPQVHVDSDQFLEALQTSDAGYLGQQLHATAESVVWKYDDTIEEHKAVVIRLPDDAAGPTLRVALRLVTRPAGTALTRSILVDLNSKMEDIALHYQRGWSADDYLQVLRQQRSRDQERGMTTSGPHRADLGLIQGNAAARSVLSRGEQKLVAAALLLTQAELLSTIGRKPLILLDDLGSEFDDSHFDRVLHRTQAVGGQLWLTGTSREIVNSGGAVFHVEQGQVSEVL